MYPRLVGVLGLYVGNSAVAEDLAQETLARAWERWDQVSAYADPEAWAYRVAFNLSKSWFRRRRFEQGVEVDLAPSAQTTTDVAERLYVKAMLLDLAPRQRATIILRYFADLDVASTARVLNCSEGTVKAATAQALERLRERGMAT